MYFVGKKMLRYDGVIGEKMLHIFCKDHILVISFGDVPFVPPIAHCHEKRPLS